MNKMKILLTPGPVNITFAVRKALTSAEIHPREPEFNRLQQEVRYGLLGVYGLHAKKFCSLVLTGSGTLAIEAMISSLVPEGSRVLVPVNGSCGERIKMICASHAIPVTSLEYGPGEEIKLKEIEQALAGDPGISHICVVHHESGTGRLNDLKALGDLARKLKIKLLVDAVNSFGAEEIDFEGWEIAACAGSSDRCLHGASGISFVICSRDGLEQTSGLQARSVYMDLRGYFSFQERSSFLFTPAVQVLYALSAALKEYREHGGLKARKREYERRWRLVRSLAVEAGLKPLLESGALACSLTAFSLPENATYAQLHDWLKGEGFIIQGGQEGPAQSSFAIATMGEVETLDIKRLFKALKGYHD